MGEGQVEGPDGAIAMAKRSLRAHERELIWHRGF